MAKFKRTLENTARTILLNLKTPHMKMWFFEATWGQKVQPNFTTNMAMDLLYHAFCGHRTYEDHAFPRHEALRSTPAGVMSYSCSLAQAILFKLVLESVFEPRRSVHYRAEHTEPLS